MDLCGHATLAAAHCIKTILNYPKNSLVFHTMSGDLTVSIENGLYALDFPSRIPISSNLPTTIEKSLSIKPKEVYKSRDFVLVYDTEEEISKIQINREIFDQINLDPGGVVVTARGNQCDFVSRFSPHRQPYWKIL